MGEWRYSSTTLDLGGCGEEKTFVPVGNPGRPARRNTDWDIVAEERRWYISIYGSTALVDVGRSFSLLIYTQSVELLGRGIGTSQDRYYTQNKRTQTSMPQVWFETTIPEFEQAKTVHAVDRAPTEFG
jgi:hypothetical protein